MPEQNLRKRAVGIAEDTMAIVKAGKYKTASGQTHPIDKLVKKAVKRSKLYKPDWNPLVAGWEYNDKPRITVTNESTLEAAHRLRRDNPCVLNFASAKNPGGGFLRGSLAQEESIARSSALYHTLIVHPEYYEENKRSQRDNVGLYLDYAIYSPDVPVFKDDAGDSLENPYTVSVLTSPAPNKTAIFDELEEEGEDERAFDHMNHLVETTMAKRMRQVLNIMADNGHRTIVLGAWGCGVFGNNPEVVAEMFEVTLKDTPYFDNVIFAIYDDPKSHVYQAFPERFGDG
jgi:uncharacterized protein (TIGR02452 family)